MHAIENSHERAALISLLAFDAPVGQPTADHGGRRRIGEEVGDLVAVVRLKSCQRLLRSNLETGADDGRRAPALLLHHDLLRGGVVLAVGRIRRVDLHNSL